MNRFNKGDKVSVWGVVDHERNGGIQVLFEDGASSAWVPSRHVEEHMPMFKYRDVITWQENGDVIVAEFLIEEAGWIVCSWGCCPPTVRKRSQMRNLRLKGD